MSNIVFVSVSGVIPGRSLYSEIPNATHADVISALIDLGACDLLTGLTALSDPESDLEYHHLIKMGHGPIAGYVTINKIFLN